MIQEFLNTQDGMILLVVLLIAPFGLMIFLILRGARIRPPYFPDPATEKVLFEESFASGRSGKSLLTRLGSANNCLRVAVGSGRLWVSLQSPFGVLAGLLDLNQRIPLASIRHIKRTGRQFFIEFHTERGELRTLELRLRHPDEFDQALRENRAAS